MKSSILRYVRVRVGTVALLAVAAAASSAEPAVSAQTPTPLSALPVAARIAVPPGPGWLGVGFGSVWLTKSQSHRLYRIDPRTNRIQAEIPLGADPELGIGFGFGSVYIADPHDQTVTRVDARSNRVVGTFPVPMAADPEGSIGVGAGAVWVLSNEGGTDSGTLLKVDPKTGSVLGRVAVADQAHAVIVAFGSVWVSSSGRGRVQRVDPSTLKILADLEVPDGPRFMAAGFGSLWVMSQGSGTLTRIDPKANRVAATLPLGVPGPGGDLDVGEGAVWVAAEGTPISKVDPRTLQLRQQVVGGHQLDTLRVGFGSAWLVDETAGVVLRVKGALK